MYCQARAKEVAWVSERYLGLEMAYMKFHFLSLIQQPIINGDNRARESGKK